MRVLGIDENGLGPVLGPLVATAVAIESPSYVPGRLMRSARRLGIGDSKETSAFGRMEHAEGVALAVIERVCGRLPTTAEDLLESLCLDSLEELQSVCPPRGSFRQCWSKPLGLPAFGGEVERGRRALASLERRGVHVVHARTAVLCPGKFNREHAAGTSKARIDLSLFERLLLNGREALGDSGAVVCGMVGGIRDYRAHVTYLTPEELEPLERRRGRCAYRWVGHGEVLFEVDADARHLPVALASMVGKYVRELGMARINRFYGSRDPELPHASGYRDPVTRDFIERTRPLRRRLRVVEDCFRRRA